MFKILIRGVVAVVIVSGVFLSLFLGLKIIGDSRIGEFDIKSLFNKISIKIPIESREEINKVPLGESKKLEVKIGLMSDSENDWKNLERALKRMEDFSVDAVFFLGDLTKWGSKEDLLVGKTILESSNLEIFVIPGDHDLAASVSDGDISGKKYFLNVFGNNKYIYEKGAYKFLLLDNSPNFSTMEASDIMWLKENIEDCTFIILSQPLYHPINPRTMGIVDGKIVSTVHNQSLELLSIIRASKVRAIIAADQHQFSNSADSEKSLLRHIVIGALVSNDEEIRNPQAPRFGILEVYSDGTFKVSDVAL